MFEELYFALILKDAECYTEISECSWSDSLVLVERLPFNQKFTGSISGHRQLYNYITNSNDLVN